MHLGDLLIIQLNYSFTRPIQVRAQLRRKKTPPRPGIARHAGPVSSSGGIIAISRPAIVSFA